MTAGPASRPRGSITTRLVLVLTLGTTLLWCAAVAYAGYASYRSLDQAFDAALKETALRLLPLAQDDLMGRESDDSHAIARFMDHRETYLSYQLTDADGRILLRAGDAPSVPFARDSAAGFATAGDYRLFSATDPATGLTITVAESIRSRLEAVVASVRAMLWPLLALVPMNIVAIWLSVRAAMRPLARLRAEVAARGEANLAPVDISGQPAELRPIADAIARLVERLREALDAERAFAANSAHELRTPIAGALAQTQRLIAELRGPAERQRAIEIEATLKRLARLSDKLMQLARADAGLGVSETPVDLAPVIEIVMRDASGRLGRPHPISLRRAPDAGLVARVDADAFAIVLRNLLDNALLHGDGGPVGISVEPGGVVRVVNSGPIVPPEQLARLTRRFERGRGDVAGAGLGLAIAETVLEHCGGRLTLASPAPGQADGFEACLQLPVEETTVPPSGRVAGMPGRAVAAAVGSS